MFAARKKKRLWKPLGENDENFEIFIDIYMYENDRRRCGKDNGNNENDW